MISTGDGRKRDTIDDADMTTQEEDRRRLRGWQGAGTPTATFVHPISGIPHGFPVDLGAGLNANNRARMRGRTMPGLFHHPVRV